MKRCMLLIFVLISHFSFSQTVSIDSIKTFINKSLEIISSNSLDTQQIDHIRNLLYSKSKDFTSIDQVVPLYRDVFRELKDHHGSLNYKGKSYGWDLPLKLENVYIKKRLRTEKKVFSTVFENKFGYIRIPGNDDFEFKKVDSIAADIISHVNAINSDMIKGWIIDLRLNTGGNMYPILLALKEFIGSNLVFGGFRNSRGEQSGQWEMVDSTMLIDGIALKQPSRIKKTIPRNIPLVLLTSAYTASTGEMTVICFIGRPNTIIIGEPTANYTTAVQGFKINEHVSINLSTDYVIDRQNKVYKSNLIPDREVIGGDNLDHMLNDKKIAKAIDFLKTSSFIF